MNECESIISKRDLSMDILRLIACFMVINMHVVADGIYEVWTENTTILAVVDCTSKIAVPLFFMLSGAFSNSGNIVKALRKAIYLFILFVFFKLFYNLTDCFWFEGGISWSSLYYSYHITDLTSYKYHLWYLPDFIVVTLLSPILNSANKENVKFSGYLAILFIVFGVIMPSTQPIGFWNGIKINAVGALLEAIPFNLPMGVGYYCLGKTIYNVAKNGEIFKKFTKLFASLAFVIWLITNIVTAVRTIHLSALKGSFDYSLLGRTNLSVFIPSVSLFFVFSLCSHKSERFSKMMDLIVSNMLFIYLIHPIFIDVLTNVFGFGPLSFNPLLAVPLKVCLVFILSLIVSLPISFIVRFAVREKKYK